MEKSLENQIAIVTGGSRGIGRAICIRLAAAGAKVYVNYARGAEAAEQTVAACKELGADAISIGFDVSDEDSVASAFAKIKEENNGQLDILVNNAGIVIDGLFLRYKAADWNKVQQVNLNGSFHCAQQAAKLMVKQRSGRIINISSVVAEMGNAGQSAYVSSKAGIIGLTKSLARELAVRNIRVNAITPGFIETEMTESLDDKVKAEHFKVIPLAKYGSSEDVANLVSFLAGPESAYITGQVIGVNGGMYM